MKHKLRFVLGFLLGGVFIVAGIFKVIDPGQFFRDIENYDLVPWRVVSVVIAFYLPWLEIICGLAVIARPFQAAALLILSGLLLIFTTALTLAWGRGLDISCGCFGGATNHPRYLLWLGRDLGLLAVTFILLISAWTASRRQV